MRLGPSAKYAWPTRNDDIAVSEGLADSEVLQIKRSTQAVDNPERRA